MPETAPEIATLASRTVYENRWMTVREDDIQMPDGSTGIYGVVEKRNFALIVAMESDGAMHLVEQYRYAVGGRYWEFPQGSWEDDPIADPLALARAELREETGLRAGKMTGVGHLFQAYGYATQSCHVFLAQDLTMGERELDHEEQGLISRRFSYEEVVGMLRSGVIKDAATVAAFGLLAVRGLVRLGG